MSQGQSDAVVISLPSDSPSVPRPDRPCKFCKGAAETKCAAYGGATNDVWFLLPDRFPSENVKALCAVSGMLNGDLRFPEHLHVAAWQRDESQPIRWR